MKHIVFKSFVLLASILVFSCENKAQKSRSITGEFKGPLSISKVELQQFGLDIKTIKDTVVSNNSFSLSIPKTLTKGMYKLKYYEGEKSSSFDFIVTNEEDVNFEITLSKTQFVPPVFKASKINSIYFEQLDKQSALFQNINKTKNEWALLTDKTNSKADSLVQVINSLIEDQKSTTAQVSSEYPFLKLLIENSFITPTFNPTQSPREQDSLSLINYWSQIDENQPSLLNSTVYASSIYNFINYHSAINGQLPHIEQVAKSKESIDIVLKHFTNAETREYAINYLSFGFKQLGREDILKYIDETYASIDQCENPQELKTRLEGYSKLKAGNKAPDLIFDGKNILENIEDTTLVVFWATWCEHCREEIPALFQYQEQTKLKVISISLDTDKTQYEGAKAQLPNFTHYCDFKKWNSSNIASYYVKGTPTFVLINSDKTIIGKYISLKDVIAKLQ